MVYMLSPSRNRVFTLCPPVTLCSCSLLPRKWCEHSLHHVTLFLCSLHPISQWFVPFPSHNSVFTLSLPHNKVFTLSPSCNMTFTVSPSCNILFTLSLSRSTVFMLSHSCNMIFTLSPPRNTMFTLSPSHNTVFTLSPIVFLNLTTWRLHSTHPETRYLRSLR